jgi:hypothetical protein
MGKKIIKLTETDLYRIVKRIINEQLSDQSIPYDIIEFVYNTTPISDFTSLDEYYEFVNEFYSDYYPTQHSSVDSGILKSDIKTPEQMGVKGYNSVDAFFVTPDIDISRNNVSYVGRDAKNAINYIVMVPESLNFLETDYDFSNVVDYCKPTKSCCSRFRQRHQKFYGLVKFKIVNIDPPLLWDLEI